MKKLLYLYLPLLAIIFVSSCKPDDEISYDGASYLHFNKGTSGNVFVVKNTGKTDYVINYGAIKPVAGSNQVKLIFDAANSTAVEGTDFQILNSTDDLSSGEVAGAFTIRALEANATQTAKKAVFKLQSSSVPNAVYDQTFTLYISLTCPISYFVGNFTNDVAWWWNPGGTFEVQQSSATELLVKDFWDVGIDMKLNFDPNTYVVTVPDQNTGYFVTSYNGYVFAKPSTDATKISSFNPCTRKMTLYINYYIPGVGSYGNQVEGFTGY